MSATCSRQCKRGEISDNKSDAEQEKRSRGWKLAPWCACGASVYQWSFKDPIKFEDCSRSPCSLNYSPSMAEKVLSLTAAVACIMNCCWQWSCSSNCLSLGCLDDVACNLDHELLLIVKFVYLVEPGMTWLRLMSPQYLLEFVTSRLVAWWPKWMCMAHVYRRLDFATARYYFRWISRSIPCFNLWLTHLLAD